MALNIAKCSSIYSSKAKECRSQVIEGVYGVFTECRSHKFMVFGRFDALRYSLFRQVYKVLSYSVELPDGSQDVEKQLCCDTLLKESFVLRASRLWGNTFSKLQFGLVENGSFLLESATGSFSECKHYF